jgi:predicted aminopeptidase
VEFNEAFATFVGQRGATQWPAARRGSARVYGYIERSRTGERMVAFLLTVRTDLQRIYQSAISDTDKRNEKVAALLQAKACYLRNRQLLGSGRFDRVMDGLNNAYLVSLATYRDNVPAFAAIFEQQNENWQAFYAAVGALGRLASVERNARLRALREQHIAQAGDDQGADQVQCETLSDHGFDGAATGAEYDDVRSRGHR